MEEINIDEILIKYEQTLDIPRIKPIPQFFLCPVGLVGSGKTTVMKPLCKRLSLLRISNDEIREIINNPHFFDGYPQKIASLLINKYAKQGYSIGLDSNASSLWESEEFNKLLQELSAKVIWIYINPPEEYILNKLKNHPPTKLFRNKDEVMGSYYKSKQTLETEGIPFIYEFDPSKDNLESQIEEAITKIHAIFSQGISLTI